jgi:anti-sigma regulatory factor (Ser/Thr protein kinase)
VSDRRTFPNAPASVSEARRFVVNAIRNAPPHVIEAVAVAVSELATNCVRHAGTDFSVDVDKTPDRLRVEVADDGSGTPTMRSPEPSELSGRGLLLVRELSDEWGVEPSRERPGNRVWFTVHLPARPLGGVSKSA